MVSLIENPFAINGKKSGYRTFSQNTFNNATLYVPAGTIDKYKATAGWKDFLYIEEGDGGAAPETKQCAKPEIFYSNGKLTFKSATEGAVCQSTITDADIKSYSGNEVQLGVTYQICVYATKAGYANSETASATLCWIDVEPKTEGITNGLSNVKAHPVLMQRSANTLTISGAPAGTPIQVFDLSGRLITSTKAVEGVTSVEAPAAEKVLIVKVGERSVKVGK